MKKDNLKLKTIKEICPFCKNKSHKWYRAYYENGSRLIKTERNYLAWCKGKNDYVLIYSF